MMTSSNRMFGGVSAALWGVVCTGAVHAACLDEGQVEALAKAQVSKVPVATPEPLNDADAACTRTRLHRLMTGRGMKVVGYKAGLTNPAVQKRFGADKPVWGRLYDGMLMSNGSAVDAAFGARPLYEADMLVRVGSDDINRATSPAQVLAAIDQIIPFIELPDMLVDTPPKLNGPTVGALNVFAKLGVTGTPITVPTTEDARAALLDSLRDMTIVLADSGGAEIARGRGSDILEHPLNAVVWLAKEVAAEGLTLKRGEVISLGSFSPLLPPKPGLEVTVTYQGLAGAEPVKVTFK
jgi:2-keto-4-pentenoate hydratase